MPADKKLTFLITSGPTREYLDPVRYISNDSSGKMGAALAKQALAKKHNVIFITGPALTEAPKKTKVINVISAKEMFEAVKKNLKKTDIIIGAAAVADFSPVSLNKNKIKKSKNIISIKLKANPDIISYCGKNKKKQIVVGFALETEKLKENAVKKLKEKNMDFVVANSQESLGSDKTSVQIISKDNVINLTDLNKNIIAGKIIDEAIRVFKNIKINKKSTPRIQKLG